MASDASAAYYARARDCFRNMRFGRGGGLSSPDRLQGLNPCATNSMSRPMNSPIFAEVFHCPVKSPMNPPNKCTFFDR
ncbi:hypothetical protein MRX96_042997 [Rhipicephalus microplus]